MAAGVCISFLEAGISSPAFRKQCCAGDEERATACRSATERRAGRCRGIGSLPTTNTGMKQDCRSGEHVTCNKKALQIFASFGVSGHSNGCGTCYHQFAGRTGLRISHGGGRSTAGGTVTTVQRQQSRRPARRNVVSSDSEPSARDPCDTM
ncbi:hypothetical protein GDO78_015168 [Eleutherodactylus coqui]|uniref:Uncharacterized protein n=1 Tax=Eleutherodactylus coqui TaxID=57060 RepID=A0A8J6E6Q4_ELECQ|nr:hypothetical protein GDO78_015168 [Eleutherodactylus coqui]